jgi:hypothetical protein
VNGAYVVMRSGCAETTNRDTSRSVSMTGA